MLSRAGATTKGKADRHGAVSRDTNLGRSTLIEAPLEINDRSRRSLKKTKKEKKSAGGKKNGKGGKKGSSKLKKEDDKDYGGGSEEEETEKEPSSGSNLDDEEEEKEEESLEDIDEDEEEKEDQEPLEGDEETEEEPPEEPPSSLACDEEMRGFSRLHGSAWVYPQPYLMAGLDFSGPIVQGALHLPLFTEDAESQGWTFDSESCKWMNLALAPRFRLSYMDSSVFAVELLVPQSKSFHNPKYYSETGIEIFFRDDVDGNFSVSDQAGVVYPLHFEEAEAKGYTEGGCTSYMGGSHYYTLPFEDTNPVNPIYKKYGASGSLQSFSITVGYLNETDTAGFDAGGIPFSGLYGCANVNCNVEGCVEHLKNMSNGATTLEGGAGASTIHLLFGVDPGNFATWSLCQAPFGLCEVFGCSCCGSPDDFLPGNCPATFPPVFPEDDGVN
jgi:hypothetical protein